MVLYIRSLLTVNVTYKFEYDETDLIQAARILNRVIKKLSCFLYIYLKIHVGLNGRSTLRVGSPSLLFYNNK